MVLVNYTTRELTAKLVFYGPGLCGKTTNLHYIYDNLLPTDRRGKMVSLATETDRTLFFDFLPLDLGTIRGLKTRLQLYTVPGQVHYNATRKIVLKGADGIVFVADSQSSMRTPNIDSFKNMKANLAEHGLDLKTVPHVFQFNKRDLADVMPVEQMESDLNEHNVPFFEASSIQGIGVEDTLRAITKLVLKGLATRFQGEAVKPEQKAPEAPTVPAIGARPTPQPAPTPAAPAAAAAAVPRPAPPVLAPLPAVAVVIPPAPLSAIAARAPAAAAAGPLRAAPPDLFALELDAAPSAAPVAAVAPEDEGEVLEVGEDAIVLDAETETGPQDLSWELPDATPPPAAPPAPRVGLAERVSPPPVFELEAPVAPGLDLPLGGLPASAGPLDDFPPLPELAESASGDVFAAEPSVAAVSAPFGDAVLAGDTVMSVEGELEGLATEADLLRAVPSAASPDVGSAASLAVPPEALPVLAPAARAEVVLPVELGQVRAGSVVERELRIPVDLEDPGGRKRRVTLEVLLRFRIG